jgi:hypothetical protein
LLTQAHRLFELWHRVRNGTSTREGFATAVVKIRFEQGVFLARRFDPLSPAPDLPRQTIDLQIGYAQRVGTTDRAPPQQCLHSHEQFRKRNVDSKSLRHQSPNDKARNLLFILDE